MSTKYGYYIDGYYANDVSLTLPISGILVKPKDDTSFVYKFKLGDPIAKFTGRVDLFLQAGGTKGGGIGGVYYVEGSVGTGTVDGLFFLNGFIRTGTTNGIYYRSGIPANGIFGGVYYINGLRGTGIFNNVYYVNGSRGSGCPVNPSQFSASPTNVLYRNGNPYRGEIVSREETNLLSLTLPNRSTIVSAITSNWIGYWPNGDATVTTILTGGTTLQPYWSSLNVPQTTNIMLSGGLPINGVVFIGGHRIYSNGALLSGSVINEGRLFRNGYGFTGNVPVTNLNVTWNGQPVDVSSMFVSSTAVPSNGSKFFTNGILAQGLVNTTYITNGIRQDRPTYYINGTKYDDSDTITSGISGFREQTLYFYNGSLANGTINGVNFINGIIK